VFRLTPTSEPTTQLLQGQLYYDTAGGLYLYDTTLDWVQLTTATGNSLDSAYNAGIAITVDGGAVALTATDAADNVVLALDQQDTAGTVAALTVGSAGDAAAVIIAQTGTGGDIEGTSATWAVTKAGVATFVGLVSSTGDVTLTGANYDIIHDADADQLEFQDNAQVSFGTGEDVEISFDATDLVVAFDDLDINFGSDGAGGDIYIYSEAASSLVTFTEDTDDVLFVAYDIDLDDNSNLVVGSDDEWNIDNASETLRFIPSDTDDDFIVHFGSANNTTDLLWYTKSASSIISIDASADIMDFDGIDLRFDDGDFLKFGDSSDFTMTSDGTAVLKLAGLATDESSIVHIGADTSGVDVRFYPATTAEYMEWDAGNEALELVGAQIHLDDASILQFGSGKDMTVYSDTANTLEFDPSAAGDTIKFGTANTDAVDIIWYSDSSGDTVTFNEEDIGVEFEDVVLQMMDDTTLNLGDDDDATIMYDETTDNNLEILVASAGVSVTTNDFLVSTDGAAASQIDLNATGTTTGAAVILQTSDGAIELNANNAGNGDIDIDAADDMTLTAAGDLTLAVTGTMKMGNAIVANERVTTVVDIDNVTLTAAQSGSTVIMTMTGAAGTVTLPECLVAGLWYIIVDANPTAGRDLSIDPEGGGTINGDAAGETITCEIDIDGQAVYIVSTAADTWYAVLLGASAAWTEE